MESPNVIEFLGDCLRILQESLLTVQPEEGCALLLGNQKEHGVISKDSCMQIREIWPCCNIWEPNLSFFHEAPLEIKNAANRKISKNNRFVIDPREQICAQRWARKNNLKVLGSAHSHITGKAIPSSTDLYWCSSETLMAIIDKNGKLTAWWIKPNENIRQLTVAYLKNG